MKNRKNSIIIFAFVVLALFMIPVSVNADGETYVANTEFNYDGSEKFLELTNIPDNVDSEDIVWEISYESQSKDTFTGASVSIGNDAVKGDYSVTIQDKNININGTFKISERHITIKPVDVTEEYRGQTINATEIVLSSGTLVSGHKITATFSGSINKVGEAKSIIDSFTIVDAVGMSVTKNYLVNTLEGRLSLTAPFEVTVDPEQEGIIGGGKTANPVSQSSSSNVPSIASPANSTGNNLAATGTEKVKETETKEITKIDDNEIPRSAGGEVDRPAPPAEGNNKLGLAVLIAIFMIIAIIVIYLVSRHRDKRKEKIYD